MPDTLTLCQVEVDHPTAPDLVLDLLGAAPRALSGRALCRAGALLGHSETAMRVALTRLQASDKVHREGRGRYRLHHAGVSLVGAMDAWRHEARDEVPWRGDWLAVIDTAVRRSDKTAWRHHQLALSLRGFAPLAHGLMLRPANRAGGTDAERAQLMRLGLSPLAQVCRLDQLAPADDARARRLWPTAALNARYRALHAALRQHHRLLRRLPVEQALRESLLLGRTTLAQLARDPMLPARLMPPGPRARLIAAMTAYRTDAEALWLTWMSAD